MRMGRGNVQPPPKASAGRRPKEEKAARTMETRVFGFTGPGGAGKTTLDR